MGYRDFRTNENVSFVKIYKVTRTYKNIDKVLAMRPKQKPVKKRFHNLDYILPYSDLYDRSVYYETLW